MMKMSEGVDPNIQAPDAIGWVEGWRAWQVTVEQYEFGRPQLRSAAWDFFWKPRQVNVAECPHGCDPADIPNESCSCGLYSAKSLEHLQTMHYSFYNEEHGYWSVVGKVANWGKVIEGQLGWRAQKAYPAKLYVPYEAWKLIKPLKDTFGVPVQMMNFLAPKG